MLGRGLDSLGERLGAKGGLWQNRSITATQRTMACAGWSLGLGPAAGGGFDTLCQQLAAEIATLQGPAPL